MTGITVRLADAVGGRGQPLALLPLQHMKRGIHEGNCSLCTGSTLDNRPRGSRSGQPHA
jgi:hypothetical protein